MLGRVIGLSAAWLSASLLAAEPSSDSIAGGWLSVSPIGLVAPGPGATPDIAVFDRAVRFGYRWGVSAGLAFEPVEHLLIAATVNLEQSIWMFDHRDRGYELCFRGGCYGWTEHGLGHLVRFGPELRLGATSRYVMAWALLRPHLGLSRVRLSCTNSIEDHCSRAETDLGPGLGAGLGVAVRPISNFAIALESSVDHNWLDPRPDPFRAIRGWNMALLAIVGF